MAGQVDEVSQSVTFDVQCHPRLFPLPRHIHNAVECVLVERSSTAAMLCIIHPSDPPSASPARTSQDTGWLARGETSYHTCHTAQISRRRLDRESSQEPRSMIPHIDIYPGQPKGVCRRDCVLVNETSRTILSTKKNAVHILRRRQLRRLRISYLDR